ncbi:retropepsin-like aspartic protease [Taibaiella soli]|uniref:Aspartyl protease n=1 Tax=Taibaiella soli TaxID=1649169 RepID=A0A2W2BTC7_9BACT|nr:retropepsin-like aspartic protease [Taibaiella soli]PZF71033.1 hypothetical protein DN068_20235 [Taibaiella soli]
MKLLRIILLTVPFLFAFRKEVSAQSIPSLNQGGTQQESYFTTLPYELVKGKIVITVTVNGKARKFILDTGAPLSITESLYDELHPATLGNVEIADQSGKKDSIAVVRVPAVEIGGVTFSDVPAIVAKNAKILFECFGVDGFIGSNLLRNSIVQFDDRNKQVTLTNDASKLSLSKKKSMPLELTPGQSNPFIKVYLKKGKQTVSDNILFDSGADGFYEISMNSYKLFAEKSTVIDSVVKSFGSYTGGLYGTSIAQENYMMKIPEFVVAKMKFTNAISRTTYSKESRIGSKVLNYGKATLDYKDKLFYFEPYGGVTVADLSEKVWPIQPALGNDKMIVGIVWDQSLAGKINAGDEILSYDDLDYSKMSVCEMIVTERKSEKEKAMLVLKDVKTGAEKRVEIEKK